MGEWAIHPIPSPAALPEERGSTVVTTSAAPAPGTSTGRAVTGAALVAALGGLLFGYDTGVISAALLYIAPEFQLSELWQQVVVASLLVGALVGVGLGGIVADALGRRRTLSITSLVFTAGAVLSALSPDLPLLLASRLLLQVHDELVLEVAPGEEETVEALVREQMAGAAELQVPLDVSVGRGRSWHEAAH